MVSGEAPPQPAAGADFLGRSPSAPSPQAPKINSGKNAGKRRVHLFEDNDIFLMEPMHVTPHQIGDRISCIVLEVERRACRGRPHDEPIFP